jgi:hypothetical protein
MTCIARIVAPGLPHHVKRGNRAEKIVFEPEDDRL